MKQQKEALFHDGSSQFCKYNEKSDTYTFILRTTIGAVNQAFMAIDGYEMKCHTWIQRADSIIMQLIWLLELK